MQNFLLMLLLSVMMLPSSSVGASYPTSTSYVGFVMTNASYDSTLGPSDYALFYVSMLLRGGPSAVRCLVSSSGVYLGILDSWADTVVYNWALTMPSRTSNLTVGMNATITEGQVHMFQSSLLIFLGGSAAAVPAFANASGFVVDCASAVSQYDPLGVNMILNTSLHRIQITLSNASSLGFCFIVPRSSGSFEGYYGAVYPIASASTPAIQSFLQGLRRYANSVTMIVLSAPTSVGQLTISAATDIAVAPTTMIDGYILLASANITAQHVSTFTAGNMTKGGQSAERIVVSTDSHDSPVGKYKIDPWTNGVVFGWLQSLPANRDVLLARMQVAVIDEITPVVSLLNNTVILDLGIELSTYYNNGTMTGYLFDSSSVLSVTDSNGVNLVTSPGLHDKNLCVLYGSKTGFMLVTYGPLPRTSYGAVYPIKETQAVLSFYLSDANPSNFGLLFMINYTAVSGGTISMRGTPKRTTPAPPTTTASPPTEIVTTIAPSTAIPTAAPLPSSLPAANSASVPTWAWVAVGLGVAGCLGIVFYAAKRQAFRKKDPGRMKREHAKELGRFDGIVRSIRADLDKETQDQYRDADEI